MRRLAFLLCCSLGACDACGNHAHEPMPLPVPRDAEHPHRVNKPTTDRVEQVPPYGIRADGVGPYKLGEKLADLLERLASGPRIALFDIPGLVHKNVIHAEDGVLIGGDQGQAATFIAIVGGADIASTESGAHVGSTRDELVKALGPPREELDRARDPRLFVPNGMPSTRVVLDGDRVAAIVVSPGSAAHDVPIGECQRPASHDGMIGACILGTGELLVVDGDEVTLHAPDTDKVLYGPLRFTGTLVFAAPLRNATEGKDELVVVTRVDDSAQRTWYLSAFRFEGARPVKTIEPNTPLYQVTSVNARLLGAELKDVDLYLEVTSRPDTIEVGGLLTTPSVGRAGTKIRDVVVVSPMPIPRRRGKSAPAEAGDAGVPPENKDGSGSSVNKSKP